MKYRWQSRIGCDGSSIENFFNNVNVAPYSINYSLQVSQLGTVSTVCCFCKGCKVSWILLKASKEIDFGNFYAFPTNLLHGYKGFQVG